MKKWDDGLTAIIAVVFGTFIAVGIPIGWAYVFTSEPPKAADWLGFAGSMLSAGIALFAARIAWRAVQRQIAVQRESNLIGVMTREEDRIDGQIRALYRCLNVLGEVEDARMCENIADYHKQVAQIGITTDSRDIIRTIQAETAVVEVPNDVQTAAWACARLVMALNDCMSEPIGAEKRAVRYTPIRHPSLDVAEAYIDGSVDEVVKETRRLEARRDAYRNRIEAILSDIDGSR